MLNRRKCLHTFCGTGDRSAGGVGPVVGGLKGFLLWDVDAVLGRVGFSSF